MSKSAAARCFGCVGLIMLFASANARADDSASAPASPRAAGSGLRRTATALVHVAAPFEVKLEGRATSKDPWMGECTSPCDRQLPVANEYRLVEEGEKVPEDPFRLDAVADGSVTLTVATDGTPSNPHSATGGVVLIVTGISIVATGVLGMVLGAQVVHETCTGPTPGVNEEMYDEHLDDCDGFIGGPRTGHLLMGASVVVAALGGVLIALGAHVLSRTPARITQKNDVFVREPTWVGPRATSASGVVAPLGFSF